MPKERAQRMSPQKRRRANYGQRGAAIVSRGLSSCTLEVVAVELPISKPLIYKYFPRLETHQGPGGAGIPLFMRGCLASCQKMFPLEEIIHRSNLRSMEYLYQCGPIYCACSPAIDRLPVWQNARTAMKCLSMY